MLQLVLRNILYILNLVSYEYFGADFVLPDVAYVASWDLINASIAERFIEYSY
jgi:hypothetical protein